MARNNEVRGGVDIPFLDKKRTIYPVSLRQLRKLNKVMGKLQTTEDDDEQIDLMVEAVQIILAKVDPDFVEDKENVEDNIDIKSFNDMVTAAMGTDPNE